MKLKGNAWKIGDDIDTDQIIPAQYLSSSDPEQLANHCLEVFIPQFAQKIKPGDMVVAGKNFGCGSSREHAPLALKAAGISCVIARSFARIFYRNSFNMGLPILECPEAVESTEQGDILEVNLDTGEIRNHTKGKEFKAQGIPPFMQDLIDAGGLMNYVKKKKGK
jgi:3-isopropylmalate/(R)-2-methylmalate dehydratase small subunit